MNVINTIRVFLLHRKLAKIREDYRKSLEEEELNLKMSLLTRLSREQLKNIFGCKNKKKQECVREIAKRENLENIVRALSYHGINVSKQLNEFQRFKEHEFTKMKRKEEEIISEICSLNPNAEECKQTASRERQSNPQYEFAVRVFNTIRMFRPEPIRSEEDFEKQLFQFLRGRLGDNVRMARQVSISDDLRVDIVIENYIALELKIAKDSASLQRLVGQTMDYKAYFPYVIAVIYDYGQIGAEKLQKYIQMLWNNGVPSVVVRGVIVNQNGGKI